LSFASPVWLVALLVVPAALVFARVIRRRPSRYPVEFTNVEVLAGVLERRRSFRTWVPLALLLLAVATAAGALARPHATRAVTVDNTTIVLLVDVSGSMAARDVEPTRLDAATGAMRIFLDHVPSRFKIGLVQFSTEPEVLTAPTHDRQLVRETLAYLHPDAGTAIGDALAVATGLVRSSLATDGVRAGVGKAPGAIVLLSDGTQRQGRLQPLEGAALARKAGFPVFTVALGTPRGFVTIDKQRIFVPPDPTQMESVAHATGGATFTANSARELAGIFGGLGRNIGRRDESQEITSWFAIGAAMLLLAAVGCARAWDGPLS
jgi:Ca-activated chloride channel family protein